MLLLLADGGFKVTQAHKQVIRAAGYEKVLAKLEQKEVEDDPEEAKLNDDRGHLWLYKVPKTTKGVSFRGTCYYDKIPKEWKKKWEGKEITKEDWCPERPTDISKAFRQFIMSSNPRFDRIMAYEPFFLYLEQSRRWEEENLDYYDHEGADAKMDFVNQEGRRIRHNKLYGANRYASVKEDNKGGGRRDFKASTPQALLCYLVDCGYHFALVKGRQAAITTVMMIIADLEMLFRPSYSGIFVVHKKDGTGKKLFRDKHQSTLQHFPKWIVGELDVSKGFATERTILDFASSDTKIEKLKDASEFVLLSGEDSMVANGQTPTQSFFDESQNIGNLQTLINEIDPALYQMSEDTGRLELVRQIFCWGTGSSNAVGRGSFESHFNGIADAFNSGSDTDAWVPIFMDWTCRPGIGSEDYLKQKQKYMRGSTEETKGLTPKERLAIFSAHYPEDSTDAFMSTHKTLFPPDLIKEQKQRIEELCHQKGLRPRPCRFHPIFNESVKIPAGGYFPYKVVGARVEFLSEDDETAPVHMLFDRHLNCANRYFQGTDPIQNDSGFSRFASAIRDRAARRDTINGQTVTTPCPVVCLLDYRSPFPEELFVQSILMGMYYANYGQKACPEVVEINAGKPYVDFKCGPEFDLMESVVLRAALPQMYRGGGHVFGLDLKGGKNSRKEYLYHDGTNLLRHEGKNLWYFNIWTQVQNIAVESQPDGSVKWGTISKGTMNDDSVYAMFYAEVCDRAFQDRPFAQINVDEPEYVTTTVRRRDPVTQELYYTTTKEVATY